MQNIFVLNVPDLLSDYKKGFKPKPCVTVNKWKVFDQDLVGLIAIDIFKWRQQEYKS